MYKEKALPRKELKGAETQAGLQWRAPKAREGPRCRGGEKDAQHACPNPGRVPDAGGERDAQGVCPNPGRVPDAGREVGCCRGSLGCWQGAWLWQGVGELMSSAMQRPLHSALQLSRAVP